MKPFNLEEARAGKEVVTRCGLPARIICFDYKVRGADETTGLIVLIESVDGAEDVYIHESDGYYCSSSTPDPSNLLIILNSSIKVELPYQRMIFS